MSLHDISGLPFWLCNVIPISSALSKRRFILNFVWITQPMKIVINLARHVKTKLRVHPFRFRIFHASFDKIVNVYSPQIASCDLKRVDKASPINHPKIKKREETIKENKQPFLISLLTVIFQTFPIRCDFNLNSICHQEWKQRK